MIKLQLEIQQHTIDEGFTQSELSLMDECALKWNYRYNNRLGRGDQFDWNLHVGSAWHAWQEGWRKGTMGTDTVFDVEVNDSVLQDHEFEQKKEYWEHVLPAYQRVYANLYKGENEEHWDIIEEELQYDFLGYQIRGKIDLASDKLNFIRDFKSTVSAWLISGDGWHFKLQFMLYCWLMTKNHPDWAKKPFFNFQLDMMQKPALKHTKSESWAGHLQRVCADVASRPEFYFKRESYKITPDMIKRFETNVLTPKIKRIEVAATKDTGFYLNNSILENPNTNACNMYGKQCEFFNICEKGWNAAQFFYTQREKKHQEL